MRIKIKDVKPGMVIRGSHYFGFVLLCKTSDKYDQFFERKPYIYMYDARDNYYGPGYSMISDINEKVKVIKGAERKKIIKDMQRKLRKHITSIEKDLQMIAII